MSNPNLASNGGWTKMFWKGMLLHHVTLVANPVINHRYSVTVNQVMVSTVKLSKWWLQLNPWFVVVRILKYYGVVYNKLSSGTKVITEFVTRLTRRAPLVEQELLTLPEHLSSSPVFSEVRVTRSLVLCIFFVECCLSFGPFILAIVLSVPLRYTDCDYPFGIFKLFIHLKTFQEPFNQIISQPTLRHLLHLFRKNKLVDFKDCKSTLAHYKVYTNNLNII